MILNQLKAAVIVVGLFVAACGPSARQKALRTNLTVLNTARDGFVVWDDQRQMAIVDAASSFDEGVKNLEAYQQQREPVLTGFEIAYRLLAVAAYDPTLVNAAKAYSQILLVWDLLKELTGQAPKDTPPKPN